jgi:hypothetical protein
MAERSSKEGNKPRKKGPQPPKASPEVYVPFLKMFTRGKPQPIVEPLFTTDEIQILKAILAAGAFSFLLFLLALGGLFVMWDEFMLLVERSGI